MKTLNSIMQDLFNTTTKTGGINESYSKRIMRFNALFTSIDSIDDGFLLTDVNDVSFEVSKYQLLGLVIENPAKLDSVAIRKGGVDNTMLSYGADDTKQAIVEASPAGLLVGLLKNNLDLGIQALKAAIASLDIDSVLDSIEQGQAISVNGLELDTSSIVSLLNIEKYKVQRNKFINCFNPTKSNLECTSTGNSKGLEVKLFDVEILGNKIQALFKIADSDAKQIINDRLIALEFKGIKWTGSTNLAVNL